MDETVADGRAKRDSVFRTASIIVIDTGRRVECRVRNVSSSGAGVSHKRELRAGMAIRITVSKTSEVEARVAWATDTQAGIAFDSEPVADDQPFEVPAPGVNAGWLADLGDAYRK